MAASSGLALANTGDLRALEDEAAERRDWEESHFVRKVSAVHGSIAVALLEYIINHKNTFFKPRLVQRFSDIESRR